VFPVDARTIRNESGTSMSSLGSPGSAVVVDVEGDPDLAGVLEHQVAVGVIEARGTGGERSDGDGAVAVLVALFSHGPKRSAGG
jgi:hypothetical protein